MVLLRRIFIVALILGMPCWSGADGGAPALHRPVVSGLFYPAEKNALSERINAFLKAANKADVSPVVGLIVPHAGYDYSGGSLRADAGYLFEGLNRDRPEIDVDGCA